MGNSSDVVSQLAFGDVIPWVCGILVNYGIFLSKGVRRICVPLDTICARG